MTETISRPAMGWLPDYPDFRDYTIERDEISSKHRQRGQKESIKTMLKKTDVASSKTKKIPTRVDLREWCSPVEDQGKIGACTAHAGVGIMEYFEKRAFGKHVDASRLFLYKATRNLLHWTGDTGAFLRTTMEALVLFGVPPEEFWPYKTEDYDKEPTAFHYAFAQNFQTLSYYRFDPPEIAKKELLNKIKIFLATGLPSMFGFTVYQSIRQAQQNGLIPFPVTKEETLGGHAVAAVGYDDKIKIKNPAIGGTETVGALLIRNSWGTGWGEQGYGWLPYEYVLKGLAVDWWSLLKSEWVDTGAFKN